MHVAPSGQACGATVREVDLRTLEDATVQAIRAAWLEHKVLTFPDQHLSDDDLEAITLRFGPFGDDPFFASIDGHPHIAAVRRRADETSKLFAENWHADWSFQEFPPDGTCLYGKVIPPVEGDTLYTNQQAALEAMPSDLRKRIEGKVAIHSAAASYAPDGLYGDADGAPRSATTPQWQTRRKARLHERIAVVPLVRTVRLVLDPNRLQSGHLGGSK